MSERGRRDALAILQAGLAAADPATAIRRHVRLYGRTIVAGPHSYNLERFSHILVLGAGKASAVMAAALEQLLGDRISIGCVNVKYGHTAPTSRVRLHECGHPVPDEPGVDGARRMAELAASARESDLVICVFSGGASALMPAPAPPITLAQKQETTRLLLASGADIHEMNCVRKHMSTLKGGQLARLAAPATVVSLLLSDVIGDDLAVIGSGPTAPDPTTFAQALSVLENRNLRDRVPRDVLTRLESGAAGAIPETPKSLDNAQNLIVGSNHLAMEAAEAKSKELGYNTIILSTTIEGETREVARVHAAIAREIVTSNWPIAAPACVLSGGETTVTLHGNGLGGRNQEFVLAAATDIAGMNRVTVLSAGTDGTDGPTDAAGAVADGTTIERAKKAGLDAPRFLENNDSYRFFDPLGDLIRTGPTNTNVMDLHMLLVEESVTAPAAEGAARSEL